MTKKTYTQQELTDLNYDLTNTLTEAVNKGGFQSREQQAAFEKVWKTLSVSARENIANNVRFNCLAMTDLIFVGKALDHCKEIATNAIAALIIAGAGAYYASGDPIFSACVAAAACTFWRNAHIFSLSK